MPSRSGTLASTQGALILDTSPNDTLTISVSSGTYSVEYPIGTPIATGATATNAFSVGAGQARVVCNSGSISYALTDNADASVLTSGQTAALQSAGARAVGFSLAGICPIAVFGQLSNGQYVCTDQANGSFAQTLFLLTGDPLGSYSVSVLSNTAFTAGNALKDTTGTVIGGANAGVFNAWPVSNGDIYFVGRGTADTKNYLFRAKAGTYTVGSDAGYTNKQACVDIGRNGGVHTDGIRHLSNRSFLEATVNGAKHYYFVEYNVASGRVAGSGGAGGDQAIVWRSTDSGNTWAVFFEFNTGGSHVIDHFHAAVQDPYTGWIYFMTGDVGTQNNVIAYNGTAGAVAANASLATIASTAGYKVLSGNELSRYTDLAFAPGMVYGMPDSDSEASESTTVAFVSTRMPKTLDFVETIAPASRQTNLPPLLTYSEAGWAAVLSFRTHVTNTNPEPYLQIWTSDYPGGSFSLVAKVRNYRTATGIPKGWFKDQAGRLWICGTYGGGCQFRTATDSGSSVALIPGERGGFLTVEGP